MMAAMFASRRARSWPSIAVSRIGLGIALACGPRAQDPGPATTGLAGSVAERSAGLSMDPEMRAWLEEHLPKLGELYRAFHRDPELSFHERRTADRFAATLEAAGLAVTREFGGHGVVGVPAPIESLNGGIRAMVAGVCRLLPAKPR